MRNELKQILDTFFRNKIVEGWFPGVVYSVLHREKVVARGHHGYLQVLPTKVPMELDTIFDVASLTKPLVTAPCIMKLVETGSCSLDSPLAEFLPQFRDPRKSSITIKQLLTHSAGFPAWIPAYLYAETSEEIIDYYLHIIPEQPPGKIRYGCPNFIILGYLLQKISGLELQCYAQSLILNPLDMQDTLYRPGDNFFPRIAATEWGNDFEKSMAGNAGADYHGWRHGVIRGSVHDQNAFSLGKIAGNSGLFSTILDLEKYIAVLLGYQQNKAFLSESSMRLMVKVQASEAGIHWGLGWKIKNNQPSAFGSFMSPESYGHTGFTGCSIFVDPERQLGMILLSNRIHPFVKSEGIDIVRREFHDLCISSSGNLIL